MGSRPRSSNVRVARSLADDRGPNPSFDLLSSFRCEKVTDERHAPNRNRREERAPDPMTQWRAAKWPAVQRPAVQRQAPQRRPAPRRAVQRQAAQRRAWLLPSLQAATALTATALLSAALYGQEPSREIRGVIQGESAKRILLAVTPVL